MSKPETNIISVPLANAYLNLNQEKDEIRQYEGFNKLNAPFYGGNLSPMYKKFLGASGDSSYIDREENVYTVENGVFKKTTNAGITSVLKDDFETKTAAETIISDTLYKWYFDDNNKVVISEVGTYKIILNGIEIGVVNDFENIFIYQHDDDYSVDTVVIQYSSKVSFYYRGEAVLFINELHKNENWYIKPTSTSIGNHLIVNVNDKYYAFDKTDGTVTELNGKFTGELNIQWNMIPGQATLTGVIIDIDEIHSNASLNKDLGATTEDSQYYPDDEDPDNSYTKYTYTTVPGFATVTHWGFEKEETGAWGDGIADNYNKNMAFLSPFCNPLLHSNILCVAVTSNYETGNYMIFDSSQTIENGSIRNSAGVSVNYFKITNCEIDSVDIGNGLLIFSLTIENLQRTYSSRTDTSMEGVTNRYLANARGMIEEDFDTAYYEWYHTNNKWKETKVYAENIMQIPSVPVLNAYSNKTALIDFVPLTYPNTKYEVTCTHPFSVYSDTNIVDAGTDYDITTTRGYAVNITDNFRLLVNNGEISALSMFSNPNKLGTLVSDFTISGIVSVVVKTENRIVYVDEKNKTHIIDIVDFSENASMQVLLDRYFVFNAIGINCYDSLTTTWYRIGLDWNNRYIISDYSNNADTKYYLTSAMFRTTDNSPVLSMLFNMDWFNKVPIPAITPQYAEDATIQLYGTEEPNQEPLYLDSYVFSDNTWSLTTESQYVGTTAEVFADNNLLIPTSLFTQFSTSYLNDVYAIIYNGFSPLYKSDNASSIIKFNFFIGSLITDMGLDALFIIQGQYYRLSNKIIYAYSYSGGVLVDTQEICNVGSLVFVGASPSEAYFWSYANRTLYRFTGARIVESVVCADSINAIYGTLYDTTTSSLYLSTNLGLVVYNAFGNFIIEDVGILSDLTSTKYGITFRNENNELYGLYYNAVDGETVIPVTLETSFYGSSSVQNVINDTLYLKIFNKDNISKGIIKFGGYIQQNYGETKEIVSKVVEVTSEQFDKITKNLLLRYQPDKQRGIGISWKIESDFPISFIGIGSSPTGELNVPKSNNPVITTQKYNI